MQENAYYKLSYTIWKRKLLILIYNRHLIRLDQPWILLRKRQVLRARKDFRYSRYFSLGNMITYNPFLQLHFGETKVTRLLLFANRLSKIIVLVHCEHHSFSKRRGMDWVRMIKIRALWKNCLQSIILESSYPLHGQTPLDKQHKARNRYKTALEYIRLYSQISCTSPSLWPVGQN